MSAISWVAARRPIYWGLWKRAVTRTHPPVVPQSFHADAKIIKRCDRQSKRRVILPPQVSHQVWRIGKRSIHNFTMSFDAGLLACQTLVIAWGSSPSCAVCLILQRGYLCALQYLLLPKRFRRPAPDAR